MFFRIETFSNGQKLLLKSDKGGTTYLWDTPGGTYRDPRQLYGKDCTLGYLNCLRKTYL